jgi:hypothetical protein
MAELEELNSGEEEENVDNVAKEAGPKSNVFSEALDEEQSLTSANGDAPPNAAEKTEAAKTEALKSLGESLGIQEPIDENTVNDASSAEPETDGGKKVKSFWEKCKEKFADFNLSDLGTLGMLMGIAGLAYWLDKSLNETADALTGCYQFQSCASGQTQPQKVGCTQAQCGCSLLTTCASGSGTCAACASPACPGQSCYNYVWKKYTPLQVLASLPGMLLNGLTSPLGGLTGDIKTLLIYGAIFIGIVGVIYIAFKFLNRSHGEEGEREGGEVGGEEGGGEEGGGYEEAPPSYTEKFNMCGLKYRYY